MYKTSLRGVGGVGGWVGGKPNYFRFFHFKAFLRETSIKKGKMEGVKPFNEKKN